MFGTIRRYQASLMVVVATITIVSFIVYFNPTSKSGSGPRQVQSKLGQINGRQISGEELSNTRKEVRLEYFLSSGGRQWPDQESVAIDFEAYKRLFLVNQLGQLGIEPGDKAVAALAERITGQASMPVDDFVDKILKPAGLNGNDFERFLRHELGIEQLKDTAGLSGKMVTLDEAEAFYRANHRELSTAVAYFSASNFLSSVAVTQEALSQFYTTNMNLRYHLRDRVQIDYVEFDITNYLAAAAAEITNLDRDVDKFYTQYGTNAFPGATNEAEARLKIREAMLQPHAALAARRAAGVFAEQLDHLPKQPDELQKLALTNKLAVHSLAPFDDEGPKDLELPASFIQTAFHLTTNQPFGGPVTNSEAAFVMALKRRLPSEIEPFEQIKARVTDDYRQEQAVELAQQAAIKFHDALVKGLAQSNRFDAICSSAGVKPEMVPPFSLSSTNVPGKIEERIGLRQLQGASFSTPVGSASQVFNLPEGAFVLYVEKQTPVDETKVKAEAPQYLASLRQSRKNESFNQWFSQRVNQDRGFMQKLQEYYMQLQGMNAGQRRSP